jgi:hypothetical protein
MPVSKSSPSYVHAYRIQVQGILDASWRDCFDGMTLVQGEDGTTTITGVVSDQAALYGMLRQVRDKGLTLLLVQRLDGEDKYSLDEITSKGDPS